MLGLFEQSFQDDMDESYLTEFVIGTGYGAIIDELSEQVIERVGLFESSEDIERRNRMMRILEGNENYEKAPESENLHANEDDFEDFMYDGDIIDSVMGLI